MAQNIQKLEKKPFWKSKTVWINSLIALSGILTGVAGQLETGVPITLVGVLGIVLRVITKTEVTLK